MRERKVDTILKNGKIANILDDEGTCQTRYCIKSIKKRSKLQVSSMTKERVG